MGQHFLDFYTQESTLLVSSSALKTFKTQILKAYDECLKEWENPESDARLTSSNIKKLKKLVKIAKTDKDIDFNGLLRMIVAFDKKTIFKNKVTYEIMKKVNFDDATIEGYLNGDINKDELINNILEKENCTINEVDFIMLLDGKNELKRKELVAKIKTEEKNKENELKKSKKVEEKKTKKRKTEVEKETENKEDNKVIKPLVKPISTKEETKSKDLIEQKENNIEVEEVKNSKGSENKKIQNLKQEYENKIAKLNETINKLTEDLARKDQRIIEENVRVEVKSGPSFSDYEIKSHLCNFPMLGTVDKTSIISTQIEGKYMICVKPLMPILPNSPYIDKQSFYKEHNIPNDFGMFVSFVDSSNINEYLDKVEEVDNFDYLDEEEQKEILYDIFLRNIIVFIPELMIYDKTGKNVCNARIKNIIPFSDFSNAQIAPKFKANDVKSFKNKIEAKTDLCIPSCPITCVTSIKYLLFGDTLYSVDLEPKVTSTGNTWKPKSNNFIELGKVDLNSEDLINLDDYGICYAHADLFRNINKSKDNVFASNEKEFMQTFIATARKNNLCYLDNDLKNFHIAVKSSQLVILAGPSGIGKTRLPLLYSKFFSLNEDKGTLLFVNINPSLNEPSDLLGYVKPSIKEERCCQSKPVIDENYENLNNDVVENKCDTKPIDGTYMEASSGLVSFLKDADDKKDKLHIVIFDEMNLAQIEYWFAPFISILERDSSDRKLTLYSSSLNLSNKDHYPSSIAIGENVLFIGTINEDETTKDISDRVLDRSIVLRLHKKPFIDFMNQNSELQKDNLNKNYKTTYEQFNTFRKKKTKYIESLNQLEIEFLDEIHEAISATNSQKGVSFRNVKTISSYLENSEDILERKTAFDFIFNQTVIQKITGADFELKPLLNEEGEHYLIKILDDSKYRKISDFTETKKSLKRKQKDLEVYGFAK